MLIAKIELIRSINWIGLTALLINAPPLIVTKIANSCIGFMAKYFEEYSSKQTEER